MDTVGPDYCACPGDIILDILDQHEISVSSFTENLGLSSCSVSALLCGDLPVTPLVARRLEEVLGVPASLWLNAERIYRERTAKLEGGGV